MFQRLSSFRSFSLLAALGVLAACADGANLGEEHPELGDFRLCYNIVTTNDAVKGPLSREADLDQFAQFLREDIENRLGRYEGDRLYHVAMHLDAYVLAMPGIPLVASPRSVLITSVHVWDDSLGRPLNEEAEQIQAFESLSGGSIVGSGLTQSAEEQMRQLSRNTALLVENWLAENPEWFQHEDDELAPAADATLETDPCAQGNEQRALATEDPAEPVASEDETDETEETPPASE